MKSAWLKRAVILVALLCVPGTGSIRAQVQVPADQLPGPLKNIGIDQRLGEQIPLDLEFRDEHGTPVRLAQFFGKKPVILNLVYYECPMLCTMVLNGVLRTLRALTFTPGDQFEILTVSFDPKETYELAAGKKAVYMERYQRPEAARGWHFLTGDEPAIKKLTEAAGFRYVYDTVKEQYIHASGIMVVTPEGKLSHYFYGIDYSPKDLRMALVEASNNKIGTHVDQIMLFCYHYDPTTGKYGLAIMNLLRVLGLSTVAVLAGFIIIMLRRERKPAAA